MAFQLNDYLPILLMFVVAGGFAAGNIVLSQFVGQRKHTRTKMMPYECGKDPVGTAGLAADGAAILTWAASKIPVQPPNFSGR